eukprot:7710532-Karenia_brevis.AAC.1
MRMLIRSIQEERKKVTTVVEEAPKKVKGSNGVVERAIQEIEGRIRSIRLHTGEDGKVPHERVKGKKPTVVGIELGEKVLYRRWVGAKMEKIKFEFEYGIFVGFNRRSN